MGNKIHETDKTSVHCRCDTLHCTGCTIGTAGVVGLYCAAYRCLLPYVAEKLGLLTTSASVLLR